MGRINQCSVPLCSSPQPFLVRGLCEFHYDGLILAPKIKELDKAKIVVERITGEVTKLNAEKRQAKLDYGVKPPPVWIHCHNMGNGCPFKSLEGRNVKIHEDYNCKFRKAARAATNGSTATRSRKHATTREAYVLTDDDITDE